MTFLQALYGVLGLGGLGLLIAGIAAVIKWGRALERNDHADEDIKAAKAAQLQAAAQAKLIEDQRDTGIDSVAAADELWNKWDSGKQP